MRTPIIQLVLALAILAPFIYDRGQVLSLFWKNAPHRLVRVNMFASHEIRFSDRIRSCEDALLVESQGLAILGCDPGRERWNTVMVRTCCDSALVFFPLLSFVYNNSTVIIYKHWSM